MKEASGKGNSIRQSPRIHRAKPLVQVVQVSPLDSVI